MNTKLRRTSRKAAALIAVAVTAATLVGCAKISYEEARASQHQVVQTDINLLGARTWSYYGPSGREVPLSEDCSKNIFAICRASADGSVEFRYSNSKNDSVAFESLILHGEEREIACVTEHIFGPYACAPID